MYGQAPSGLSGRGFVRLVTGRAGGAGDTASVYIHTTDDGVLNNGQVVWTLHAKLIPSDFNIHPIGSFGTNIASDSKTILVSSPRVTAHGAESGAVYIFNGTRRHWTQIQKLVPSDALAYEHLGDSMLLQNNRLLLSAEGYLQSQGAAYIYERNVKTLLWSRQAKLIARDAQPGCHMAQALSLSNDLAVLGARNDDYGIDRSGSAYIFRAAGGKWSQQQKLVAIDQEFAFLPLMDQKYIS